jgi:hypothetical protein
MEQAAVPGTSHAIELKQARGTGGTMDAKESGKIGRFIVAEGTATVTNSRGSVTVAVNQETDVTANAPPPQPKPVDASQATSWAGALPSAPPVGVTGLGPNLIVNGDAEAGPGGDGSTVEPAPGWTTTGNFNVIQYGQDDYVAPTDPGPPDRGNNFFAGGPNDPLSTASQSVNVSGSAAPIDGGKAGFQLSGWLGGWDDQEDNAVLTATFKGISGQVLGSASVGPVSAEERHNQTGLLQRSANGVVPKGTRSVDLLLVLTREAGANNDGYADNLSLALGSTG